MSAAPPRVSSIEYAAKLGRERAQDQSATARRLYSEFRPYRRELALVFALNLVVASSNAAAPWLISRAIDRDIMAGDGLGLAKRMLLLLAVYVIEAFASRTQMHRINILGHKVLASFRERLFEHYLHLPLHFLNQKRVGDLISRAINDVSSLNSIFTQSFAFLPGHVISLIGTLAAMLVLNVRLALASFAVIPLMQLSDRFFAMQARKAFRDMHTQTGEVTSKIQEDIATVREAQAFDRVETNIKLFRERIVRYRKANLQAVGVTSASAPAFDVLSTLGSAIVIGYGAYLVTKGELTVGLVAAFLIYVQQFYRPIQMLSQVRTQMQSSLAAVERIFAMMDEPREPEDLPGAIELDDIEGRIEFKNVTFTYEEACPVLHEMSFSIEPGQTVALVGPTGAGKTTIANLIPRLYDPQQGSILIDGVDLRAIKKKSVRSKVGIISQEPFVFNGTIEENIAYACDDCTHEDVVEAARIVAAHDFIEQLPQGYETKLDERGKPLSQGQRQLITIARVVLSKPRIIIFDEATGTVDVRTEAVIVKALKKLLEGRTSVVIAHRLSTIRDADLVLVLDKGRIVEAGKHNELLARRGLYFDLFHRMC